MKIALTGHRPQRLGLPVDEKDSQWNPLKSWIRKQVQFSTDIYCGMATGSDIALGLVAASIKSLYEDFAVGDESNFNLHCILPCKEYNSLHPYYYDIKQYADEWIELSDEFYKGCDNVRDQYMVDHCDVLIAIWDGNKSGGVWSTICKAQKAGKDIIYCPAELINNKENKTNV